MKRRNFFMSLTALAVGVKVAPAAVDSPTSLTVTSRIYEELVQASLSQKHNAGVRVDSDEWSRQVQKLIVKRRCNPHAIHSMPFPVIYQKLR